MSTRGTCAEEKLQVRAPSDVTHSFFPFIAITQRSSLTPHPTSQAARLNLQFNNRNFHRGSSRDLKSTADTRCKAALFRSSESTNCSHGSEGFAALLPHLQPGILLLRVKASPHRCITVCFLWSLAAVGVILDFHWVMQNSILRSLISTAGTKRSTLTSHYSSLQITLKTDSTKPFLGGKLSQMGSAGAIGM